LRVREALWDLCVLGEMVAPEIHPRPVHRHRIIWVRLPTPPSETARRPNSRIGFEKMLRGYKISIMQLQVTKRGGESQTFKCPRCQVTLKTYYGVYPGNTRIEFDCSIAKPFLHGKTPACGRGVFAGKLAKCKR
jgi:hypothetical protein